MRSISRREHDISDIDLGDQAYHHSIGNKPGQSASGQKFARLLKSQKHWKAANYQNAWTDWGPPYVGIQYCVDSLGRCWLRGRTNGGATAAGTVVVNGLPIPDTTEVFTVVTGSAGAVSAVAVNTSGELTILGGVMGASISVSGISYMVEDNA